MKTFYHVMTELYDDGTVKTAVVGRARREKPENSCRNLPGMEAYNDWFDTEAEAAAFMAEIKAAQNVETAAFDFDVLARGSFIDNAAGGDAFRIEAITLRLNRAAFDEYLDSECSNCRECYDTDQEWKQHKAEKEQKRMAWEKTVAGRLGFSVEKGKTGVAITQAHSEVFTVVYTERL
jgi:superfamily II DNA helicase RecQ